MGIAEQSNASSMTDAAVAVAPAERATAEASSGAETKSANQTWLGRLWSGWVKPVGMAMIVVFTLRSAVADWNDVPSQSMEPTILIGDRIFVNKLAYDLKLPFTTFHLATWGGPDRGDVVVFYSPPPDGKRMVKRVVGLPGDTVQLRQNRLYINGAPVSYQPLTSAVDKTQLADPEPLKIVNEQLGSALHAVMTQPQRGARKDYGPVIVPAGQYFVMGDNRDNSGDSRYFGFVNRDAIVGKAVGLAFSLDHNNSYMPRWSRFFRGL
jgi:signal peptidase I